MGLGWREQVDGARGHEHRWYLHGDTVLIAIQIGIFNELTDGLDDLLELGSVENTCLKHLVQMKETRNRMLYLVTQNESQQDDVKLTQDAGQI